MTAPTVGVLLPVRDAERTLPAALESIAAQTLSDFEVWLVDDGSHDASPDIAEAFAARDPRFRCLRRPREGLVPALEAARRHASSPILARHDADDTSLPGRFAEQVTYLRTHPDVGVVATGVEVVCGPDGEKTDGSRRYERWLASCVTPEEVACGLWIESPLPHPTVMIREPVLSSAGGYRDKGWPEDYDLWLRLLRRGVRMAKVPEVGLHWYDRPERASRTQPAYARERFLACRVHHLAKVLGDRAVIVWGAGRDGRHLGRALLREGVEIVEFWDIDPRKIGRTRQGRPIHSAEESLERLADKSPVDDPAADTSRVDLCHPSIALTRKRPVVLSAVGAAGARPLIQEQLRAHRFLEGRDFLCLA